MLYADDAVIVSKSAEGLAKIMTVIVTVVDSAGVTVSEKTETMQLRAPDGAPRTSHAHRGSRPEVSTDNAVFYARDQTAGPTHMGMLQSIQAGAVRYGGCPVCSEVAHAKGRGDGNPALRVRKVDPRQGALR